MIKVLVIGTCVLLLLPRFVFLSLWPTNHLHSKLRIKWYDSMCFPSFVLFSFPLSLPFLRLPRRLFFNMFPRDFRFRNHVFLQSLTFVYVAETRNSVPETYYFVLLQAETWRYYPASWRVFPCSRCPYCVNTSKNWVTHLRKPSFPFGIFLNSFRKLTFGYFSFNLHAMKTYSLYTSDKYIPQ